MSYFGVTVEGIPSIDRVLDVMAKAGKQLPFAISLAVNKTAEAVRLFEIETQIPSRLTVRNKWPLSRGPNAPGVQTKHGNKLNPSATVGSSAWFLEGVERGAQKMPRNKAVMVPEKGIRQTQKRLVASKNKPQALLAKTGSKKAFFLPSASGPVLFTRIGPGPRDLKAWFFGKPSTQIRPILDFEESGEAHVKRIYQQMFGEALGQALKTAK